MSDIHRSPAGRSRLGGVSVSGHEPNKRRPDLLGADLAGVSKGSEPTVSGLAGDVQLFSDLACGGGIVGSNSGHDFAVGVVTRKLAGLVSVGFRHSKRE